MPNTLLPQVRSAYSSLGHVPERPLAELMERAQARLAKLRKLQVRADVRILAPPHLAAATATALHPPTPSQSPTLASLPPHCHTPNPLSPLATPSQPSRMKLTLGF